MAPPGQYTMISSIHDSYSHRSCIRYILEVVLTRGHEPTISAQETSSCDLEARLKNTPRHKISHLQVVDLQECNVRILETHLSCCLQAHVKTRCKSRARRHCHSRQLLHAVQSARIHTTTGDKLSRAITHRSLATPPSSYDIAVDTSAP